MLSLCNLHYCQSLLYANGIEIVNLIPNFIKVEATNE